VISSQKASPDGPLSERAIAGKPGGNQLAANHSQAPFELCAQAQALSITVDLGEDSFKDPDSAFLQDDRVPQSLR